MPNDKALFLGQFLRSPAIVGAVAPSSRKLAQAVTTPLPESGDPVIVELGPGTGPFTAEIQRRLGGRGHHLAVEINAPMARVLAERYPRVDVVVGDACELPKMLADRGLGQADVIVSGLPWAAFPRALQLRLMSAVTGVLAAGGAFTTFAYVHALPMTTAKRFRRLLTTTFEEVVASRTVWGNLPPAFVYNARRARVRGAEGRAEA
ncbi:Phospholipid N-methyltransferase [Sinosporangium album]|uniref:Phospholipid N-methyltransferase n=1 Tax=Sinosporangium album TaxID=504805 RepID=A0A1G7WLM3_9ACTN|nr:methyltransferase domain-containing protein [Sinosporangium album]SDG72907.1 Phospholipid N-methyltransferase [Sinosporangium album]